MKIIFKILFFLLFKELLDGMRSFNGINNYSVYGFSQDVENNFNIISNLSEYHENIRLKKKRFGLSKIYISGNRNSF